MNEASASETRKELQELRQTVLSFTQDAKLDQVESQSVSKDKMETIQTRVDSGVSLVELRTMLLRVSRVTATIFKEDWILNKLRFGELHNRESSIQDPHTETFRWLLYDPSNISPDKNCGHEEPSEKDEEEKPDELDHVLDLPFKPELSPSQARPKISSDASELPKDGPNQIEVKDQESEERTEARSKFLTWLSSGSGVFHVSGKLGSGKSTLMKFLSRDRLTKKELQKWAGNKRLVFGQFFFWASGDPMQRSLEGLYRGILWEVLRECPGLMKNVFPRYLDPDFDPANDRLQDSPFPPSELEAAFESLIKNDSLFNEHKICFFIDGLDEYEGDHWKLARRLKRWSSAGGLKICASSRPYNEFINNFTDPENHFRLHELTRLDIKHFVQHKFEHDERFLGVCAQDRRYAQLVDSLIEKADGVFLWVRLATDELLKGMGNRYSVSQLKEQLNQLPGDLEALLRKLLKSICKPDRMRSAHAFLTITADKLNWRGMNKLAIVYAVIDELYDTDSDATSLYSATLGAPLGRDDMGRMTQTVQNHLNSRCKGLIQLFKPPADNDEILARLGFIHRSVYELLTISSVRADLAQDAGSLFDLPKLMCMAFLRLLKGSYRLAERDHSPKPEDASVKTNDREAPFGSYFWLLKELAIPLLAAASATETETTCPCLRELEVASETVLNLSKCLPATSAPTKRDMIPYIGNRFVDIQLLSDSNVVEAQGRTWLALCALWGARRFVVDRVSQLPDLLSPSARGDLLFMASVGALGTYHGANAAVKQALVASLLERGVSPNWPLSGPSRAVLTNPRFPRVIVERQTTWNMLLWFVTIIFWSRHIASANSRPMMRSKSDPAESDVVCKLIGQYLEFGADPTMVFVGYQITLPEDRTSRKTPNEDSGILAGPTYFDLGQLIEAWDPPSKEELLALWKSKIRLSQTLWDTILKFTKEFWQGEPLHRIPQIKTESLRSRVFFTVTVASVNRLSKVDLSEFERWALSSGGRQWMELPVNASPILVWYIRI